MATANQPSPFCLQRDEFVQFLCNFHFRPPEENFQTKCNAHVVWVHYKTL